MDRTIISALSEEKSSIFMKIKFRVSITNDSDEPFMGIGIVWLLERVKKLGSINSASKEMNMSYAKSIKMINSLEKNLGKKVIIRKQGGNERTGAELTSFGEQYIMEFEDFQNKIKRFAEGEFKKFIKTTKGIRG